MEELETIKSYIIITDSNWKERNTNLTLTGDFKGEGYAYGVLGNDTKEKLQVSIKSFKDFYMG
jgi:hypothetical protein